MHQTTGTRPPGAVERWSARYFAWVVAHPWAVLALCLVVLVPFGLALRATAFEPDSRIFFGERNAQRLALERLERVYATANTVVLIVAPRDGRIFTRETLGVIERLTQAGWKTPHSSRVDSLANYDRTFARGDDLLTEPLYRRAERLSDADLARIKATALADREIVNRIVSAKGDVAAVVVFVIRPGKSRDEVNEIAGYARRILDEARKAAPSVEFRLTGGVIADAAFAEAGSADAGVLVPLMLGLIVAALWITFRSATATFATSAVVMSAVIVAMGAFVGTGSILNGATSGAPVIIMTICILDSVHVIMTMTREMRAGRDKRAALLASLKENNVPMFITSFTDVIGFLVLNFAESPPINELGNIVGAGAVAGYLFSISLLPALLVLLPAPTHRDHYRLDGMMAWFADFAAKHRRAMLAGMALLFVGLGSGIFRITLDDDFIKYFDERFAFRRDTDFLQQRLTGLNAINFSLPAGEAQGITKPEYLAAMDKFAGWFRQQDKVVHVIAFSDVMRRLNRNLHGDDAAYDRIPDTRRLAAQLLLLYEMSMPEGRDLRSQMDVSKSSTLLTVMVRSASSSDVQELGRRGAEWLKANAPAMATEPVGLSVAYAYLSENNIRMMLYGTFVGLALISLTMFFVLRSARLGVISLIPNLIPAVMAYGLWGYLFGEINLAVSVVGSFTFGIIVDDTVHFVTKYYHHRRDRGSTPEEAVRYCFTAAGLPAVLASIVLTSGFVVLCFSGFAINRDMGSLSAITIMFGLLVELFLLPALLLLFGDTSARARARQTPATGPG